MTTSGEFVLSSSVMVPGKLYRLHADPRVSLTFTHFVGSGLVDPAPVLVQGDASLADGLFGAEGMEDFWREMFRKKPDWQDLDLGSDDGEVSAWSRLFWRVRITVRPKRVWLLSGPAGRQELEQVR